MFKISPAVAKDSCNAIVEPKGTKQKQKTKALPAPLKYFYQKQQKYMFVLFYHLVKLVLLEVRHYKTTQFYRLWL